MGGKGVLAIAALQSALRWGHRLGATEAAAASAAPEEIVYRTGVSTDEVFAVCQGWALRFVALADGRRQNLAVLLPGDLSLTGLFQEQLHFSVAAVTTLRIRCFFRAELKRRILGGADMIEMCGKAFAAEQRDVEQRAVDLGRRNAEERVAHLFLGLGSARGLFSWGETRRMASLGIAQDQGALRRRQEMAPASVHAPTQLAA
jgi:CRP-like cAMP-binding protein